MTGNDTEHWQATAPRTATGALDHAAIEARARQLRRVHTGTLLDAVTRRIVCTARRLASTLLTAIPAARAGKQSCRT